MEVSASAEIDVAASDVWRVVREFNGLPRWLPGVTESRVEGEGPGAIRHITLKNGMKLSERLESFDEEGRSFSYSITEGPLPVENYLSTVSVAENGSSSTVTWVTQGDPKGIPEEQLGPMLSGVCEGGVAALKAHCELQSTQRVKKIDLGE